MTKWVENDELFKEKLDFGREAEVKVATALMMAGIPVQLTPQEFRKNFNDRHRFLEEVDVWAGPWGSPFRIEVHHIKYEFNGVSDYPWPEITVIKKWKYDAQRIRPTCFVFVSEPTGAMIVVSTRHDNKWTAKKLWDKERKHEVEVYQADMKYAVDFKELVEWLQQMCRPSSAQ